MKHRTLGQTSLQVSPIALGCMSLCSGQTYDEITEEQAIATVHAAIDAGINFFDTAPGYGDGESERRLGKALGKWRDKFIIADKIGSPTLSAQEVQHECEKSLRFLQTDYIDLYQIHWPRRVVAIDETLTAMEQLVQQGKVRAVGVCNFGPLDLNDLLQKHTCATNQLSYSLLFRALEHELQSLCMNHGIDILCYSPLAQGMLTGRYRHADEVPATRARTRHFSRLREQVRHGEEGFEIETFHAVEKIRQIAAGIGHEMSDVAIAWLLTRPGVASVLVGASKPEQVRRNVAAMNISLSQKTLDELDAATSPLKDAMGLNLDPWQSMSRIK